MKFSIRDLFWLTLLAACCTLWWMDRDRLDQLQRQEAERAKQSTRLQCTWSYPVGQVSNAFWKEEQETDEAAEFVFHDQEFLPGTVDFAPGAKRHLEMNAIRMPYVTFPIVLEPSSQRPNSDLDAARRQTILNYLNRMGVTGAEERVVVAGCQAAP